MGEKKYWYDLDRETSSIGFGCWQIAGSHRKLGKPHGWGEVSQQQALEILSKALHSGVDFFDTAQGYNNGVSEQLLGRAIKATRTHPVICTKIALTQNEVANNGLDRNFIDRVEGSLKRLQIDFIDILLLHNPPDNTNWNSFDYSLLNQLRNDGKIGTYGISSISIKGAVNAANAGFGSTIEWVFNVFERRPETELFPIVREKRINFIARSPLSRGLINPTYIDSNPHFSSDHFRSTLPTDWVDWVISQLRILSKNGVPAQDLVRFALLYCSQFPEVTATIVGIRTLNQLSLINSIINENSIDKNFDANIFSDIPECYPKWK